MPNLSQITKGSITWTFSQPVNAGQFANGDYWVVGPITITSITPRTANGLHGSMLNPVGAIPKQGFDERLNSKIPYAASLNVAQNLPLVIQEGSLLSSESLGSEFGGDHDTTRPKQIQILTVLRNAPSEICFRPGYCDSIKNDLVPLSSVDFTKLANLPKPDGSPIGLSAILRSLENPWIDNRLGWTGRYLHPADNMPGYGREVSLAVGDAALAVHLDYDPEEKKQLCIRLIQLGIDLFNIIENGGSSNWYADGGHASGRKWPIVFAGLMLNREEMKNVQASFGEDQQTFYVSQEDVDLSRASSLVPYSLEDIDMPEWGIRHSSRPYMDNKAWDAATYRLCCTATAWVGSCLAAIIMDAVETWNHKAFFDYMDRHMTETVTRGNPGWQRSWSNFATVCWDQYRENHAGTNSPGLPGGVAVVGESSEPTIRLDVNSSAIVGQTLELEISGAPIQNGVLVIGNITQEPLRVFGGTSHIDLYKPTVNLPIRINVGEAKTLVTLDIPPFVEPGSKLGVQAFWLGNGHMYNSRAYEITIS